MTNPGQILAQAAQAAAQAATAAFAAMSSAVTASTSKMAQSISSAMGQAGQSVKDMADRLANAGGVVGIASGRMAAGLTAASVGVLAFVRAGLQGTTEGARLGFQMQLLSREVASLFLPAIDEAISLLSSLVNAFQNLNGAQQQAIFQWSGLVAGVVLFVTGINPVIGAITAITAAFSLIRDNPAIINSISDAFGKMYSVVKPVVDAISELASTIYGALVGSVKAVWPLFESLYGVIKEVLDIIGSLTEIIAATLTDAIAGLAPVFEGLLTVVTNVFSFILDMIGKMIRGLGWILDKVKSLLGIGSGGGGQPADEPQQVLGAKEEKKGAGRREVTLQAGGFEALNSTGKRIQEGLMKTFDPQQAHNEQIAQMKEQNANLVQVVGAVKGVNVGVGN